MSRFVMEHLPRAAAVYHAHPVDHETARLWMEATDPTSLVRTPEMISAVEAGMGLTLTQAEDTQLLLPGDEALLITLSFSVLLAWAEDKIAPLPEDWRCLLLKVHHPDSPVEPDEGLAVALDVVSDEPV